MNAFTCMENGHEALAEAARRSFVWVEYAAPGQELAAKLAGLLAGPPAKASVSPPIVMQNHGFIAPAANARDAIKLTHDFVNAGERFLGPLDASLYESSFPSQPLLDAAETICGTVMNVGRERTWWSGLQDIAATRNSAEIHVFPRTRGRWFRTTWVFRQWFARAIAATRLDGHSGRTSGEDGDRGGRYRRGADRTQ